jgi:hypothetical protein
MESLKMSSVAEIIEGLSEDDRAIALQKIAHIEKRIEARRKLDELVADSLLRVLKTPLGKILKETIKDIAKNG